MDNNQPDTVTEAQAATCFRFGTSPVPCPTTLKAGVSEGLREGRRPIHGLRHPVTETASGWYLWAGEDLSADPEFFKPLHVSHLVIACPAVLPYLAMPPGWRFLLAEGHEDVWFDPHLLDV